MHNVYDLLLGRVDLSHLTELREGSKVKFSSETRTSRKKGAYTKYEGGLTQKDIILKLFDGGATCQMIEEQTGVCKDHIRRTLQHAGRIQKQDKKSTRIRSMLLQGISQEDIAMAVEVTKGYVSTVAQRYGIETVAGKRVAKRVSCYDYNTGAKIGDYRTADDAAWATKCSPSLVRRACAGKLSRGCVKGKYVFRWS